MLVRGNIRLNEIHIQVPGETHYYKPGLDKDDTSLNTIRLFCQQDDTNSITSSQGEKQLDEKPSNTKRCPDKIREGFIGARVRYMKSDLDVLAVDNMGAANLEMKCGCGESRSARIGKYCNSVGQFARGGGPESGGTITALPVQTLL